MHSENQTPRINAAKEIGALVAGGATYQSEELRLKAVDNHIQKALEEISDQYKDAAGENVFSKNQIDCINHICLQMFCILDPETKPPTNPVQALGREIRDKPPLARWKVIGGFLGALVALITIFEFVKPYLPTLPTLSWPEQGGAKKAPQDPKPR